MKNKVLLLFVLITPLYIYAQNGDKPQLLILDQSYVTGEGDTINQFFASFSTSFSSTQNVLYSFNMDLNQDFTITARFETTKTKSGYGIGFINAYGSNTAGFLINEKGEYKLYVLFDGTSCLLDGNRSYEGWKKTKAIRRNSGQTNFLKLEKKEQNLSIYINEQLLETCILSDKLGQYYFTDYGIIVIGEDEPVAIQSFSIDGTKKKETN
jgi:hypothetical protein